MFKKVSKRIVAVVITLSLLLSLLMIPGNEANAVDRHKVLMVNIESYVMTGAGRAWVSGFIPKEVIDDQSRIRVASTKIDNKDVPIVNGSAELMFYNGEYWLDPDEPIYPRTQYTIMYRFEVTDPTIFEGITSYQFYLGDTAFDTRGYAEADVEIDGNYIMLTVRANAYSLEISPEAISAIDYDAIYREKLPTKVSLLNGAPYMLVGTARWSYCNSDGMISTVTKADKIADGVNSYYILELTLQAKSLFLFSEADYHWNYDDGRELFAEVSDKGRTATVKIIKIVPKQPPIKVQSLTEIALYTRMSFGTNDANTVADIKAALPKSIQVMIEGSDAPINLPLKGIDDKLYQWSIREVSGDSLSYALMDGSVLTKSDEVLYAAVYSYAGIEYALNEEGYTDDYHLLSAYRYDIDYTEIGGRADGYTILFSIRPENTTTHTPQAAFKVPATPVFTFTDNGGYCMYSVKADLPYSAKCVDQPLIFDFGTNDVLSFGDSPRPVGPCGTTMGIFKAISKGMANISVDSPIVYRLFDPIEFLKQKMQQGVVSVTIEEPKADNIVTNNFAVTASGDYESGLDFEEATLTWSPKPIAINTNYETFEPDTEYVAEIKIPIKRGYEVTKIPQVRVNGITTTDVESDGLYLIIRYKFTKTAPEYWIDFEGNCNKKIYFTTPRPYAGAVIPNRVEFTDSTSRIVGESKVEWYANGQKVEDDVFEKGKRYNMILTIDMKEAGVMFPVSDMARLIGNCDFVTSAYADPLNSTLTVRFDFGECKEGIVVKFSEYVITLKYGMTPEDFATMLAIPHYTEVVMNDGGVTLFPVEPGFDNNGVQYATIYDHYKDEYRGAFGYDPRKKTEQVFNLIGNIDLSNNGGERITPISVKIVVPAKPCVVKMDANGGTYEGPSEIHTYCGEPYGFEYVKEDYKRARCLFAGWYTEPVGGKRVYSTTLVEDDITLYAHWQEVKVEIVKDPKAKEYKKAGKNKADGSVRIEPNYKKTADGFEVVFNKKVYDFKSILTIKRLRAGSYTYKIRAYRYDSTGAKIYGYYGRSHKFTVKEKK